MRPLASRVRRRATLLLADPLAPVVALCLILVASMGARVVDLDQPCTSPCKTIASHTLIFDEHYYVNAARVIAGIEPAVGQPYRGAPLGDDPNAEHPQLAKLVIAGGIELFGDNPRGWRIGSILFGLIAIAGMYFLVRSCRGSGWLAVGASSVMALDNLMLVHGRIATLDIYAVAMMILAAAFYMRRHPLLAGLAAAVAACMKEVGIYIVAIIVLLELVRLLRTRLHGERPPRWVRESLVPLALFLLSSVLGALGLLWLLDALVPAYDPGTHHVYSGDPFAHIAHMYKYAQLLKTKPDEIGISATPWQWLLNETPINYARVAVNHVRAGHIIGSNASLAFKGQINPFIIFLLLPALFTAARSAWREADPLATLGVCWCVGGFLPFVFESQVSGRITYLYYMVIVMPGVYLVLVHLFSPKRMPTAATLGWAVALVYGFLNLYPLRKLL